MKLKLMLVVLGILILLLGGVYIIYNQQTQLIKNVKPNIINNFLNQIKINPIYPEYLGTYKVQSKSGNESLYDINFEIIPIFDKEINIRNDTKICLEAKWDKKEIDENYNYSVPTNLSLYKTKPSILNPFPTDYNLDRELEKDSSNIGSKYEEGDTYKFCYQANPEKDFYLKFGDNSVIVIQEVDAMTDALLENVTVESGDVNFSHLNISNTAPYDDLVGYWSFDGDKQNTKLTTHYDFSQYDNNGIGVGDALINSTNCIYDDCLHLDGAGDRIDLGTCPESLNTTKDISLCAWIYPETWGEGTPSGIIYTDGELMFYVTDGGKLAFHSSGGSYPDSGAGTLSLNIWQHACAERNSTGSVNFYINGSLTGNPNQTSGVPAIADASSTIGSNAGGTRDFNGSIDEFMFFNTSLSATEILDIYNNQSARFFQRGSFQLNNQSVLNITAGDDRVNVTTFFENEFYSNISLQVGYYDGSWSITNPQNITSGKNATFTITSTTTNLTLNYTFLSGNLTDPFYTPIMNGTITLHTYAVAVGDTTDPIVNLNSPVDFFNSSSFVMNLNCSAGDDINLTNISLYGNWSAGWHLNETNSTGINDTSYTFTPELTTDGDGDYIWNCFACDNSSNCAFDTANRTFIIDTTPPAFDEIPPNLTITEGTPVNFTVNATDVLTDLDTFSINDTANFTISPINGIVENSTVLAVKIYYFNVTVNDTLSNINSLVMFVNVTSVADSISPNISIAFPANESNSSDTGLNVNYTTADETAVDACWYSNDSMSANTTLPTCANITTITWIEGQHNVTVWVNDTSNNINSSFVRFTIDTIPPNVNITYPANHTNTTDTGIDVNYTRDSDFDACWYSNDTMSANTTLTSCVNITGVTWTEGRHNVTIWVNDSVNNQNRSFVTFVIDNTGPTFDNLVNFTQAANITFSFDLDATDAEVEVDTFRLNDTSYFNISSIGLILNVTNLSRIEIHYLNVTVNDTLGNAFGEEFYINITKITPPVLVSAVSFITPHLNKSIPYIKLNESLDFT